MRLSIVIPTHRDTIKARARLLWAASWASDDIEVVIRDNSGSAAKRTWLAELQPGCRIVSVEPCSAHTNYTEAVRLASADFVLFQSDDDAGFDRGIRAIAEAVSTVSADASVSGLTGAYVLEEQHVSHVLAYAGVESPDVVQRLEGYLGYQGPNVIFYSAIRRRLAMEAFDFMERHPFQLPFHDNLFSLIYLLAGRLAKVNRLTVIYDNANWDTATAGVENDLRYYRAAGLDPVVRQLHWLLCGFEGACIALGSPFSAGLSPAQRQMAAQKWLELMIRRFAGDRGRNDGSAHLAAGNAIVDRIWDSFPTFALPQLLDDICAHLTLSSDDHAARYRAFWAPMIPA